MTPRIMAWGTGVDLRRPSSRLGDAALASAFVHSTSGLETTMRASLVTLTALALTAAVAGCPDPAPEPAPPVVFGETEGLAACDTATAAAHPDSRCFTFRGVAGVSMGGGTAGRIGFRHPELWDVVGIMGTPFADNDFFFRILKEQFMGGFCSLEHLEQLVADGVDLDDDTNPDVFCGVHDVFPLVDGQQASPGLFPAVEGSECALFRSDFNHWYRGPEAGRGGSFNRNSLLEIVHDLVAGFGNPFYDNPESAYFPPGVPDTWHVRPRLDDAAKRAELCANPIVLNGVYNREFNPEGAYPVITFCDGNQQRGDSERAGEFLPDERGRNVVIEILLAVDLNGNGIRDYGEPVFINDQERFRDCGSDNACDGEAGDTEDDDWDPLTNPSGTEGNARLDEGEVFDDDGLDGVPATGDTGEGNGLFDRAAALDALLNDSPAALYDALAQEQVDRLDVWMDAGVRDFLNSSQISNALFSEMRQRQPSTKAFNGFKNLPIDADFPGSTNNYLYTMSDYSREAMGQVAYLRYGDASVCPSTDDNLGDGNHVGAGEIVSRIFSLFSFLSARMPAQGRDRSFGGDLSSLGPTGRLNDFAFLTSFDSKALDRGVEYGVLLPPDYFLPEAENEEYPVLYFFHGQGMEAADLVALGLALLGPMKESSRTDRVLKDKTDLQRAIIIWADGNCLDDDCYTGNFYTDFKGLPRDDRRYETAFYELVHHVEGTYRTKKPELIPLSQIEQ